MPDLTGTEPDKLQEVWVLFDKQVQARELYSAFAKFKAGVTVIVIQDADHAAVYRRPKEGPELSATVIVLAGSSENQSAMDGRRNGAFTEALLAVWNNGTFPGTYSELLVAVRRKMPQSQSPQLYVYGPNPGAKDTKPFRVSTGTQ